MTTRTQFRAICPVCFAQQAVRNGRLADHGYRRPQLWHSNVGTCSGAGAPHFGTPEGREFTRAFAQRALDAADHALAQAERVVAGAASVFASQRVAVGVSREGLVENPTPQQRERYAAVLRSRYTSLRQTAQQLRKQADQWAPVEPIEVQVEPKQTLVHLYSHRWQGKACAGSAMGAQKGYATREREHVTCAKCKASRAWQQQMEAVR